MTSKSPQFGKLAAFAVGLSVFLAAITMPVAAGSDATSVGNNEVGNVGGLAIGVQQGAGNVAITVTNSNNGSLTPNASVDVNTDNMYTGEGSYSTDSNGQLILPGPEHTVNATITAEKGNLSASKVVTLHASNGTDIQKVPRGIRIASFVHSLQDGAFPGPMGQIIAVLMTNFWELPSERGQGPSASNGPDDSSNPGPPEHAKGKEINPGGSNSSRDANPGNSGNEHDQGSDNASNNDRPGKSNENRGNSGNKENSNGNGKAKGH